MKNLREIGREIHLKCHRRWEAGQGQDTRSYGCCVLVEPIAVASWPDSRNQRCLHFPGVNSYFGGVQGGLAGLAKQLFITFMKNKTCILSHNIYTLDPNLGYSINHKFLQ